MPEFKLDPERNKPNILQTLQEFSVLLTSEDNPFILASGAKSLVYVDIRRTALTASGIIVLSEALLYLIAELDVSPKRVAGVALGGCPLATGVSFYSQVNCRLVGGPMDPLDAVYVRKESKDHGTNKMVEGIYEPGDRVILTEDVITSGGSTLKAIESLTKAGLNVVGVVAVLDRETGGRERIEKHCPFKALVTISELVT